jgi:hypothetical protein
MKVKGKTSGKWEDPKETTQPKSKSKKKTWYEKIDLDAIRENFPTMNGPGRNQSVKFKTYFETAGECQRLFDRNKGTFATRDQVDALAHYVGARLMWELFKNGMPRTKLSILLEEREPEMVALSQMQHIKTVVQSLMEMGTDVISEDELDERCVTFIETFTDKRYRIQMAKILDELGSEGEMHRMDSRLRTRKHRLLAKEKGIQSISK